MTLRTLALATACLLAATRLQAADDTLSLSSPNQRISVRLQHTDKGTASSAFLSIQHNGTPVFHRVGLGLKTDRQNLAEGMKTVAASAVTRHTDDYEMLTGKRRHCVNHANERTFTLENEQGRQLELVIRAYDDGVTFRYRLPDVDKGERLTAECTSYDLPDGQPRWLRRHEVGHEGFYPLATTNQTGEWDYPALMEVGKECFALLTDADLQRHNCGTFLVGNPATGNYTVRLVENALPVDDGWTSAWHTLIIGSLADVVESTLVTDVSTPCTWTDTSWIKPGVASWIYWAHNHGSRDCNLLKQYIDLAADMKWPYTLIDAEWDQMGNGGDINDVIAYAHTKGVLPLLWYNSTTNWIHGAPTPQYRLNRPEDREKEFDWLEKEGVKGVKVDFFPTENLPTINYYYDLIESAARHHLLINLHGGTLPWGWQRTFPNLITLEAVYGAEWYNNNDRLTPLAATHNATLPFTRNVIGSMDYTPGTFTDSQHPHITTHGHELALTILFESGMQHMPDRPETYRTLPEAVRHLLSTLPTTWDDTRLLSGYPGESVVLARRNGNRWYIAGINGSDTPRTLSFSLQRLGLSKDAKALLITDGTDGRSFQIQDAVWPAQAVEIPCLERGGFVMLID